jgi:hypothetical protein
MSLTGTDPYVREALAEYFKPNKELGWKGVPWFSESNAQELIHFLEERNIRVGQNDDEPKVTYQIQARIKPAKSWFQVGPESASLKHIEGEKNLWLTIHRPGWEYRIVKISRTEEVVA